ncbi:MAG: hypothetical protein LBO65_08495 [Spirochaetaceae bacterium]|jgi:hypothetical protein|nr:hypothetical protein [Spirochaetaceae bacterium]
MRKVLWSAVFILWGSLAVSAQSLPSITLENNTGYTVYCVYVSPSEDDTWGDDLLGEMILAPGETFNVQLSRPLNEVKLYDFCLQDEDGDEYYKWSVSVTNNARISFTMDDLGAAPEEE